MYYIFFETGNSTFFKRITDAFCSIVVQSVVDNVYAKTTASQTGGLMPDMECIQKELFKKNLMTLNCTLFPDVHCGNQECADNKMVLTSDQIDIFEVSMTYANHAFIRSKKNPNDVKLRLTIQKILQDYRITNANGFEHIKIRDRQDHNEYLRLYIAKTNDLKDKAQGFVYVRAKVNSDYDYFRAHTDLYNVKVCDNF